MLMISTRAWEWAANDKLLVAIGGFSIAFLLLLGLIAFNISDYLNNEQQRKNDLYYERLKNKRRKQHTSSKKNV